MALVEDYDVVVLGSGEGGKYVAWTVARTGKRAVVIERKYIGGSCPNIACLPSKNIIHSAKVASFLQRAEEFGIRTGDWTIDMEVVRDRKRRMVDGLVTMHLDNFKASGAELAIGNGKFVAATTIEVTSDSGEKRLLRGEHVVLSVGTRATLPDVPGLIEATPLTHVGALELAVVPEHLLVLGGGYIGLELAQAMRRFGSKVTVIERSARLASKEDPDVSEGLHQLFADEGIEVYTETTILSVGGVSGERVRLVADRKGEAIEIEGSHLLVATGRTPNTDGAGLEVAGVESDARGYIKVNDRLQTTADSIWAVGDCAGSPHFTHIAFDDFRVVRDNLVGGNRSTHGRMVPSCMFTDPELARVGLSETEANAQGIAYRLFKIPMIAVLRTRTLSETRGFMKALVDANSDRILGFTEFGVNGGETMGAMQLAITAGLPYTAVRDSILTHPTMAEGLVALFSRAPTLHPAGAAS
jgi:pyruvate/2-oxoglutarate dehydrogenase complex dihydrolipoamide dehydrogenase (E3) component